jgi:hypothetical protein
MLGKGWSLWNHRKLELTIRETPACHSHPQLIRRAGFLDISNRHLPPYSTSKGAIPPEIVFREL